MKGNRFARSMAVHVIRHHIFDAILLLAFVAAIPVARANSFDCSRNRCGLPTRGNNPHLIVGTIESIATRAQMKAVFQWTRHHGYWKNLPDDADGFTNFVQLVSLAVTSSSGSHSVTVLMTRKEFDASPLRKGALVRYSPHDAAHDAISYTDPAKEAYWILVGCIAQLCAPGDKACRRQYRTGVYDRATGAQLKVGTDQPISGGVTVNPLTLFPVHQR